MAPKAEADEEKTGIATGEEAQKTGETTRKRTTKKTAQKSGADAAEKPDGGARPPQMTQDDVIQNYRRVYDRCMEGETKSFDAKGALSALDQISKLLGLDEPVKSADIDGNKVILTFSDKVGERGD